MKDAQPVGTSLEVLAPYLPYGIDIQAKTGWGGGLDVMAGKLVGLTNDEKYPVMLRMVNQGGIKTFVSDWELAMCLPILRPFSALATPLEDGTVPALRAFQKVLENEPEQLDWSRAKAEISQPAPHSRPEAWLMTLFVPVQDEVGGFILRMSQNWVVSGGFPEYERLFLRALLAEHAAVGLEPHQYIEKSAAAPIIQEGTSQPE